MSSPRPTPKFYIEAQTFSTKKARGTPVEKAPPRPPIKIAPPISRIFSHPLNLKARAISFKGSDASLSSKHYNEDSRELYFEQCFDILSKIGAGSFGEVFKVKSKEDGKLYAVKRSRERFRGESDRLRKLEEVKKHEALPKHQNCIRFIKAWEERQHLYIQTELCSTSLSDYAEMNHDIPETLVWKYLVDLLLAVNHLHDHDLLHLDIKPDNIFISSDGICKIGDFGLVIDMRKIDKFEALEGDPKYLASEVLEGHFTKAADIFSLGITILELACDLDLPRGGDGWQKLRHGLIPEEMCTNISQALKIVITLMMEPNYLRRPGAEQILNLPQIKKVRAKRKWELKMKLLVSATMSVLSLLWVHLTTLFMNTILKPMFWLKDHVSPKGIKTPTFNGHNGAKMFGGFHGWDGSFSDDEVFEDSELNSALNNSLGVSPLSDTSTSDDGRNGSQNSSFFLPNITNRLLNSTPAIVKHRPSLRKSAIPSHVLNEPISNQWNDQRKALRSVNNSPFALNKPVLRSSSKKKLPNTMDNELYSSTVGPRNLMDVFNAAKSDTDDDTT